MKKFYIYALCGILLLAIILGFFGLTKGLWSDEIASVIKISHQNTSGMVDRLKQDVHPPFYYLLLYFWGKISKQEEFLRLFSLLFSVGSLAVVMTWVKRYSTLASLLAGLYLATSPVMLRYSQEIKGYSLIIFATSLAFLFASYLINKPDKCLGYVGLCLSLTVAVSTHLLGIMLIPAIACFIAIEAFISKTKLKLLKLALAISLPTLTFIYFKFFWLKKVQEIQDTWWWMPPPELNLISSTYKYLFGLSSLYLPVNLVPGYVFIFSALLATCVFFGKWRISTPFLMAAVIFWLEILIYSIIQSPIFYYRILLPGLIPFAVFIALQIATISNKKIKLVSILCLIILTTSYSLNWITNQAYKPVEENRAVAEFVESEWQSNDLVVSYPAWYEEKVNYYLENISSEKKITVWQPEQAPSFNINTKELEIFCIVFANKVQDYNNFLSNMLESVKSQNLATLKINLLLIKSHNSYFSKKFDDIEKFITSSESKLGKPYFFKDFELYSLYKYRLVQNN